VFDYRVSNRVQTGMEFLDRKFPHWWDNIDLDVFSITDPFHCVLTLATGKNYYDAVRVYNVIPSILGFTSLAEGLSDDDTYWPEGYDEDDDFNLLQHTWVNHIANRQKESNV
jgi:hypothetical protein